MVGGRSSRYSNSSAGVRSRGWGRGGRTRMVIILIYDILCPFILSEYTDFPHSFRIMQQ